ncbi:2-oxo-Delta(3)-4,5,5-trimethylcyclopentenylacetyl-CoA monooxygenase [Colletotrichum fructicola]|nr:2-oxo-Delta(3)-4,5,5-trimethylcyclopentenylacetyl-CoA monooxygenase [Colletotrichum fructicola]KAF4936767.1 2-oxo-Delta(3)-4,5,5-trimethylcyclopentenylacetyl-CoA monooxygenase [Colletotrichum fructicola]KAF5498323.1 2-oxo-Delta(3)-4,5,5-trimethylcyclopentenylacetyl-CoA monooxygenase [Colletotrichum fructicola]
MPTDHFTTANVSIDMEPPNAAPTFDVIIIGAGLSGITCLHHVRQTFPTWRVKVVEAADEVGGTWYFNRYPGARLDSESISYHLSWDKEYLQRWNWTEEFASQPEILDYIRGLCDKNELRRDIRFNTRIVSAKWEDNAEWLLVDAQGACYRSRFVITCAGILSTPQLPDIPGIGHFAGQAHHTSRWPKNLDLENDLKGKRIGVIGTGATGIQTITAISKVRDIRSLTVFQRSASWCAPLRNSAISSEKIAEYKTSYEAIFDECAKTSAGFLHGLDPRKTYDVSEEERLALWEHLYNEPGFGKWMGVFADTFTDPAANQLYSNWIAAKMRSRVNDPALAEKLIPKDHGFGTKRVPLDSGYLEAYNKDNVHLVDLRETPISTVMPTGILMRDGKEHELDVLVFATGFDAITGALNAIEWTGKDGRPLFESSTSTAMKDCSPIWTTGETRTFLGLMAPSLPNVFMILGPHQPFGNIPRSIENSVGVVMRLLQFIEKNGYTYCEPKQEAADRWFDHVVECSEGLLSSSVSSWSTGVNTNVEGRSNRRVAKYSGTYQQFLEKCWESENDGWAALHFQ